jgi:uncharacterized membrane protein YeaQ/YmgE (transglycosylase-associated protein family)
VVSQFADQDGENSPMTLDPLITFVIVLLIGIIAGVIGQRGMRSSWLSRLTVGGTRADITSALVGIAGAFIGFHIGAILALSAGMIVLFIFAAVGAALVLWGWKTVRL